MRINTNNAASSPFPDMPTICPYTGPVSASISVQVHDTLWRVATVPAFADAQVLEARLRDCTDPATAVALTHLSGFQADCYLSAVLNVGWQEANYVYADGAWFYCPSINPSERVALDAPVVPKSRATEKQLQFLNRITMSHHFDRERECLRDAGESGSEQDCSLLLDWCKTQIERRKLAEKGR